jgi:GxxExxY protein
MKDVIFPEESYKIVGICMEVHRELGMGFKEAIYKDILELEFIKNQFPYEKEKLYDILYKGIKLKRRFPADFVVFDKIILEIKASTSIVDAHVAQTINYLKASGLKLGIIANFGQRSFEFKRVVF